MNINPPCYLAQRPSWNLDIFWTLYKPLFLGVEGMSRGCHASPIFSLHLQPMQLLETPAPAPTPRTGVVPVIGDAVTMVIHRKNTGKMCNLCLLLVQMTIHDIFSRGLAEVLLGLPYVKAYWAGVRNWCRFRTLPCIYIAILDKGRVTLSKHNDDATRYKIRSIFIVKKRQRTI